MNAPAVEVRDQNTSQRVVDAWWSTGVPREGEWIRLPSGLVRVMQVIWDEDGARVTVYIEDYGS